MRNEMYPPGPRGELSEISNLVQWRRHGLSFLARIMATHGDIAWLKIGEYPIYLLNHPSLVKQVLLDHHENLRKPESIKVSNRGHWGEGLTSLDGDAWRQRRRLMQPIFHRREMARWSPIIVESTAAMIAGWHPGQEIRLFQELVDLRARIAARIVLDAALSPHDAGAPDTLPPTLPPGTLPLDEARGREFVLTPGNSQTPFQGMRRPRAAARVEKMLELIRKRLAEPGDHEDVLSYLRSARGEHGLPMLPDDIVDEILQMFFAGHLTVPTWLARLWYVLWAFPDLDAKACRESRNVLRGRLPTFEDLPRLAYGEQLIKETGRFFAPAPILYREVAFPFSVAGYMLEQGAGVWICPQLLHHDPRNFEKPHEFQPRRFEFENSKRIPRYAYLPFGAGPRTCIARSAAMAEMKLILATICQTHHLVLSAPPGAESRELCAMPAPEELIMRVETRSDPV